MHYITLSWDDGFRKSFSKAADMFEEFGLRCEFNVLAAPSLKNDPASAIGNFCLWNELKARGHCIQPHGYNHTDKSAVPFEQAKELILKCLDVFDANLDGFERKDTIFSFPYNRCTPELEAWLPSVVRAYRRGYRIINELPSSSTVTLWTNAFGPGNGDAFFEETLDKFLAGAGGWMIYNMHGLDGEGWGPLNSDFLRRKLQSLVERPDVEILTSIEMLDRARKEDRNGL